MGVKSDAEMRDLRCFDCGNAIVVLIEDARVVAAMRALAYAMDEIPKSDDGEEQLSSFLVATLNNAFQALAAGVLNTEVDRLSPSSGKS